jgi:dTDP-4-amino-4,6-dideoxygalactose transaminase
MIQINKPIMGKEETKAVLKVIENGYMTSATFNGGPKVQEFEKSICKFTGAKYAVAVNSGTAALQASLMALDIGVGDEVAVPSFTFAATVNAIKSIGANPIFIDIEPFDYTMSPYDLQKHINEKTKAIIPVHIYGHSASMDTIMEIAKYFNIPVVEDACQSLGTIYKGKHTGTIGKLGCYSFYPGKIITTGEGGVVVTNNTNLHRRLLMIRNHGMVHGYDTKVLGLNLRMTEIAASIGVVQMKRLPVFIKRRRENALYLSQLLHKIATEKNYEIIYPIEHKEEARNQSVFTITTNLKNRDRMVKSLNKEGFGATVYYPTPVHQLPLYKDDTIEELKYTDDATKVVFSVPIHPNVTKKELTKMAKIIEDSYHV